MTLSRNSLLVLLTLLSLNTLIAQDSLQTVIAKNGDGIFSILRNEGIDVVKYYAEFLDLNENKIIKGSQLIVGEVYLIPDAPDSFKRRGTRIEMPDAKEMPIFKEDLASLKIKDSTLKNTVFYVLTNTGNSTEEATRKLNEGITVRMARKLLQSSARVYLLNSNANDSLGLIDFVSVINKKFLKHRGDYQRLLVLDIDDIELKSKTNVVVYHYAKSEDGKRFADNILNVLGKNTIKYKSPTEYSEVFEDPKNIAFAKNVLPTITFIDMGAQSAANKKTLKVTTNKKNIADLITSGILSDYSNTEFEEDH
ncbi:MAG: hypothetical protein HKP42_13280 [Maribacter sp.]|nr:N-acetylmuramoyl-L-alanine amidase [Maribacter sp.]NNK18757.1 hypothetical protein [Maribacter sp.]NNK77021.1 hypothetical protein [Maribacter sp.]